jgi:hypothetical protein
MKSNSSTFALKRGPLSNNRITPFNSKFQGQRFGKNTNYQRGILLQDGLLQCKKFKHAFKECFHSGKDNHVH